MTLLEIAPVRDRLTSAEYRALPETNQIQELIDGELIVNPPLDVHQIRVGSVYFTLRMLLNERGHLRMAPTGVHLEERHDYEPDVFWVSPENTRCALGPDGRYWYGPPDLIVEILSPTSGYRDYNTKYLMYEKHGVREYWIIEPTAQFVNVFRWAEGGFQHVGDFEVGQSFESSVLGAVIDVKALFD
jgi:Uma2 family endonuclease